MRRTRPMMLLVLLSASCIVPGAQISPYGKTTTLYPTTSGRVTGELIAVRSDSIWALTDGQLRGYAASDISKLNVERHPFDGKRTLAVNAATGAVTGVALMVACNSYRPKDGGRNPSCAGVIPATVAVFTVLGGIFALTNNRSSMYHLVPSDTLRLRAHARFPQGLPDSLPLGAFARPAAVHR